MKTATGAKNRFDELIGMALAGPVRVPQQGRDVVVVLLPEKFCRLSDAASAKVGPAVQKLHPESAERSAKVYEALTK